MKRLLIILLPMLLVSVFGCVAVDCGYTQNELVRRCTASAPIPITYSVNYRYDSFEPGARDTHACLQRRVCESLQQSGRYSDIVYSETPQPGRRHVVFDFQSWSTDPGLCALLLVMNVLEQFIPPVYADHSLDGTVSVYENGRRICAVGTGEVVQTTVWLPLIPFGFFWHIPAAEAEQREGIVSFLVNAASAM